MTRPTVRNALSSAASGALWLARWMLVLLLVCDQIGSPLHLHRHDSGVDALWSQSHGDRHAEERDSGAALSHAVLAVRTQAERQCVSADVGHSTAIAFALMGTAVKTPDAEAAPPASRSPRPPSHRSLPPAGRAPPFHA